DLHSFPTRRSSDLPELVAVAAPPLALVIVALVLESHADAIAPEAPQALAQGIVLLAGPLGGEELDDGRPAGEERVAIAPDRIGRIGERHPPGVAGVPRVLGGLYLLQRARQVEG